MSTIPSNSDKPSNKFLAMLGLGSAKPAPAVTPAAPAKQRAPKNSLDFNERVKLANFLLSQGEPYAKAQCAELARLASEHLGRPVTEANIYGARKVLMFTAEVVDASVDAEAEPQVQAQVPTVPTAPTEQIALPVEMMEPAPPVPCKFELRAREFIETRRVETMDRASDCARQIVAIQRKLVVLDQVFKTLDHLESLMDNARAQDRPEAAKAVLAALRELDSDAAHSNHNPAA